MRKEIGIIGFVNLFRYDDGIGLVLLKYLKNQNNLPYNISYIDGGTCEMNLIHLLAKFNVVMLIDALDFKGRTGEARVFGL